VSDEPESRNDPGSPAVSSRFLLWLFIGLIAYPLSLGPVLKVMGNNPPAPVQCFYLPLVYVVNHSKTAETALDWYLEEVWRLR
jgi:hypothetical protein